MIALRFFVRGLIRSSFSHAITLWITSGACRPQSHAWLRTIEDAWGMPELGGAACDCAPPMADFFVPNTAARR